MPEADGVDVIREAVKRHPSCRIIAMTGERGEQQLVNVVRHDCIPFAELEGTEVGNVVRAAGGDEPLASLLELDEPRRRALEPATVAR